MDKHRNQVDQVQGVACPMSGLRITDSPDPCAQIKARALLCGRLALHRRRFVSAIAHATFTFSTNTLRQTRKRQGLLGFRCKAM